MKALVLTAGLAAAGILAEGDTTGIGGSGITFDRLGGWSLAAFIVWYLLTRYIPKQNDDHREALKALVDGFREEREADRVLRHEGNDAINKNTLALAENTAAVNQMCDGCGHKRD